MVNNSVFAVYGNYKTEFDSDEARVTYEKQLDAFSENLRSSGLLDAYMWRADHDNNIVCSWGLSRAGLANPDMTPYLVVSVYDPEKAYRDTFREKTDEIAQVIIEYADGKGLADLPLIFRRGLPQARNAVLTIYRENGCVYQGLGDSDCYENDTRMNVTTLSEEESRMAHMAFSNGSLFVTNETTSESIQMYLIEKGLTEERKAAIDPYEETRFFRKALLSFFRWAGIVKN